MRVRRSVSEVILDFLTWVAAAPFAIILSHWSFKMPKRNMWFPNNIPMWNFPWRNAKHELRAEARMSRYPHDANAEHFKARLRDWGRRPKRRTFAPAFAAWMAGEWELAMELAEVSERVRQQFIDLTAERAA